jgi:hypothetical protein
MENTYHDLRDCYENWDNVKDKTEKRYREKIFELAQQIVEMGEESLDDFDEE